MITNQELTKRIMRRVYMVYALRQVTRPVVRAALVMTLIVASLSFVSVSNIIMNIGSVASLSGFITFIASAFLETEFFVQFAALGVAAIGLWSIVDMMKRTGTHYQLQS